MKRIPLWLLLFIVGLVIVIDSPLFEPQATQGAEGTGQPAELKMAPNRPADSPGQVQKIELLDLTNAYRIKITASTTPTYTVFKASKPDRIMVDLPEMLFDATTALPGKIQNEIISGIKITQIEKNRKPVSEIEISLNKDASYNTTQQDTSLFIDIVKPQTIAQEKSPTAPAGKAPSPMRNILKDLTINEIATGYQIEFITEQEIKKYYPLSLRNPARLAIDFPSTTNAVPRSIMQVGNPLINTIRIGSTGDRVRCVIDFKTPALPPYQIAQKDTALTITVDHPVKAAAQRTVGAPAPVQKTAVASQKAASGMTSEITNPSQEKAPEGQKVQSAESAAAKKPVCQQKTPVPEQAPAAAQTAAESSTEKGIGSEYTGQKISLDFKDADIKNILRLISDVSGFNVITSDKVSGRVTLKIEDIPWDQALDIILESNNLGKIVAGNIIRIDTLDQILKSQKDKMEKTASQDLVMDNVAISYVKAKEIEKYIKDLKILTDKRGSINSFEHTNSVTITDVPEKVTRIKQLIREQDIATPQVLIEARIVQSNPSYVKELGVIWGSFYNTTKDGGKASGGADIDVSGAAGKGSVVNLPAPVGAGSGGGINFGYITNSLQLDLQLTALEKDEKIKIVSSPKVLSLDNKEARIKQGVALPYLKLSEQGVTSTEFKDAVLELKVTPRISPANTISLHVYVTKNQVSAQKGANNEPGIDVREVETDLLVDTGKTVVIGGIYETTKTKTINKVPFFGDIPLFGYFFRNTRNEDQLTELLVFLTVSIVNQPQITSQTNGDMQ
jgi:type IV pilus assembly protein PilQ